MLLKITEIPKDKPKVQGIYNSGCINLGDSRDYSRSQRTDESSGSRDRYLDDQNDRFLLVSSSFPNYCLSFPTFPFRENRSLSLLSEDKSKPNFYFSLEKIISLTLKAKAIPTLSFMYRLNPISPELGTFEW